MQTDSPNHNSGLTYHRHSETLRHYATRRLRVFYRKIAFCAHGLDCEDCCWMWVGATRLGGYGNFSLWFGKDKKKINIRSHVFMYRLFYSDIPDDPSHAIKVCHSCDVPGCCSYHHLFLGSAASNIKDAIQKGRTKHFKLGRKIQRMERNAMIFTLYEKGFSYEHIALQFHLHPATVRTILKRGPA